MTVAFGLRLQGQGQQTIDTPLCQGPRLILQGRSLQRIDESVLLLTLEYAEHIQLQEVTLGVQVPARLLELEGSLGR